MEPLSVEQLKRVSAAYRELIKIHPELELRPARSNGMATRASDGLGKVVRSALPAESDAAVARVVNELVALSQGRPAILIRHDDFDLTPHEALPDVLSNLLKQNRAALRTAIRGVGRIEVSNHPLRSWIGTGFVVASPRGDAIVVTNQHVAAELAFRRDDGTFSFVEGLEDGSPVAASLDMGEEVSSVSGDNSLTVPIAEVLHIEAGGGPDIALLRLVDSAATDALPRMNLAEGSGNGTPVAAIGYPARDTRETDLNVVLDLLGDVFNKKRLAPGILKEVMDRRLSHDCSTLGGNSGSPLVDLRSATVVGLHYGGTFPNPINHAVPARIIADRLAESARPVRRPPADVIKEGGGKVMVPVPGSRTLTVEVPLRITVEIGEPAGAASPRSIDVAVDSANQAYAGMPGVVAVRRGIVVSNGQYTNDPAVIVAIDYLKPGAEATIAALPATRDGFPLQVRAATAEELLRVHRSLAVEAVPRINYVVPQDLSLDPVDEEMFAVFHVSPDAGWPQLREFLERTNETLTLGLYNFATDHVRRVLEQAVAPEPKTFDLVLGDAAIDREDTKEFEEELVDDFSALMGDRFRCELADGQRRLFAGHYHIKVAIRDSEAFWLSSGNWEPSNQPEVDPVATGETGFGLLRDRNREWHAIVLNRQLAETFEKYIRYDLDSYREIRTGVRELPPGLDMPMVLVPRATTIQERSPGEARYFAPLVVNRRLKIQPLLTPDNFIGHVQALVDSATSSIDLQNQTLKWRHNNVDPRFERLMNTILDKHRNGVAVRFILRGDFSPEMKELLVEHGFDPGQIRLISRCHTKGMIVDGRRVLLGSHNLSEHGAIVNRDASLIVDDEEVAQYFARIFQFDWNRASSRVHETPPGIILHHRGDAVPEGYEVVPLMDIAV
ncbi:phospholipase D-like domain-containing protein [Rhodobium gokarnense]|uniref:Phospholipase D n=1 Tax=Rhodobium gokarnense TaxID=364296 RepID=A0ABT3HEQ6_9HYPH|nr:phospholipase D-like domain-containing protein [Rhodobium gokarnense]MCW2308890.1 hypothetical protein [Rhodobium gokarnense]